MTNLIVFPEATEEIREAARFYAKVRKGLAKEFRQELESCFRRIVSQPNSNRNLSPNARCCSLNRFPYGVVYFLRNNTIYVVAVMHLHRDPEYWKKRIPEE